MKKFINYLIVVNLTLLMFYLASLIGIFRTFLHTINRIIIIPMAFGIFLAYILKPVYRKLIHKKLRATLAIFLVFMMFFSVLSIIIFIFGRYIYIQGQDSIVMLQDYVVKIQLDTYIDRVIEQEYMHNIINNISRLILTKFQDIFMSIKGIFNEGLLVFSDILLVILIAIYTLKDENKIRSNIDSIVPSKYSTVTKEILDKSDEILGDYILGQFCVALSLATMIFIGYKIIRMPSAILLASITFVLAFIPFVGFFISMIIPYIFAVVKGPIMVFKLTILFIISQTVKGRIVVPMVMGRAMKIHPITDIFLVVIAANIFGPIGAFTVVPIYSLLKMIFYTLKKHRVINSKKYC
ncbi:AI-2E family transporter [Clostridium sp. MSJ-8]|uniref:AI-2E family transporter n=1 Tax=Clostridium sp. MSJ-8 TaxID=2841510 RepID=UPI001C0ED79A|nr:AI-2E family transporter [Clostridium sp. MSJ-8]MBU5486753.1 AI-2E family transporter [Clostridium sp. MSJ-8]